jgi:aspartyl aminopeptidase
MASANDYLVRNFEGEQPAANYITKKILNQICKKEIPEYLTLMQERLVSDAVEKARRISSEYNIKKEIGDKPFFVTDEDLGISGAIGNSFALVKPGKKDSPLRIIIAHSDVPSLRIPVNPVHTERDSERELACPSITLCTEPFGGVRADDWYGMEVDIIGKIYFDGKEKRVELPGRIKQKSLHVDDARFMKTYEGLKVDTGLRNVAHLYNKLGIKTADDFARARLYCLPHFTNENNGRMVGNELGGFGHDDRCCVWASLKASLETLARNDNTTLVFALDNEEIGSVGNSASYRGFFENTLRETLKVVYGDKARDIELPAALNRRLLGDLPSVFADVGVGLGPEELDDAYSVNYRGASRLGWGVMINSGITTSPKHISKLLDLFDKKLPGKKQRLRYQVGGDYTPVDSRWSWKGDAQMYDAFGDAIPCVNIGIPVTGLHHPRTETINVFDLFWLKEAYKVYLEN